MTKQLYYTNSYKLDFKSEIISKNLVNGLWEVVLKETYFYPEGGGQPGDIGTIDGIEVIDTVKDKNTIIHKLKSEPINTSITGKVDYNHRISYMSKHTAQHLVSGILKRELDINTLSVHLSQRYITIDIDRSTIENDEVELIENRAMELIRYNHPVVYHLTDKEGLKKLDIRREPTVDENIRIVEIKGYDMVPCGGVHLAHLGEVGLIKVISWEKVRGNIRLTLLTGNEAYGDYRVKQRIIHHINRLISTTDNSIISGVEKLREKISRLSYEKLLMEKFIVSSEVATLLEYNKYVKIYSDLPKGLCRSIAGKLRGKLARPLLLLDNSDKLNWFLIDSKKGAIDFSYFKNNLLPIINGRGGGKEIWQGSGEKMKIMEFAEKTSNYLATN